MLITLSGDDTPKLNARLREIIHEYLRDDLLTLNLSELDGSDLAIDTLRAECDTVPFMGEKRVVVVKGYLGAADGQEGKRGASAKLEELSAYTPEMPESTVLVVLERRKLSATEAKPLKAAGEFEEYLVPDEKGLPSYIREQMKWRGVSIEGAAAALLAQSVVSDPRRLDQELEKLAAYVGEGGTVTAGDVRELVNIPLEVMVWDLTDALFAHDTAKCVRSLRSLLASGQAPQQVMGAIASQVRNLVIADENRNENPNALASRTGMKPFVARKSLSATRNFRPDEPRRILAALMTLDADYKTGKVEIEPGLESLLTQVCLRRI